MNKILRDVKFEPGINDNIFQKLSSRVKLMKEVNKNCVLLFDEISLSKQLVLGTVNDKIVGYVDLGKEVGRKKVVADHALVFMLHGINKAWKQPMAYYFTASQVKTNDLLLILNEAILAIQGVGLNLLATVCDLGSTFRAALKIQKKRFQTMYKVKEQDFDVSRNNKNKMKVSRAAKLMSNTVAAAIESMIGSSQEQLPAEAIYTAEFVEDIDSLFDSLNSHTPKFNSKALRRLVILAMEKDSMIKEHESLTSDLLAWIEGTIQAFGNKESKMRVNHQRPYMP
ncbi:uncharacterized protein [Leptinotarsa decemlineata]|uniref:uncharacterized protein n=1 Tax=Leptinotarsa decemlineata TaxID=7539 RepID=UPI003D3060C9